MSSENELRPEWLDRAVGTVRLGMSRRRRMQLNGTARTFMGGHPG